MELSMEKTFNSNIKMPKTENKEEKYRIPN